MIDGMMLSGWAAAPASSRITAAGTSVQAAGRGNAAATLIAPSGITRGIPFLGSSNDDASAGMEGRVALVFIQGLLILLVVGYVWTRNVQGGG